MSRTPEQEMAIETKMKNVIVSAGAGSGKTTVLTEHVIRMLKDNHINEFLILTFTNEAANEMKNRIREKLLNNKEELDLIDIAHISTFDAFTLSLVKKYHYLLEISSNVKVVDSSLISVKKIKTIEEIFDELYDSHNDKFINIINTFFIKNKDDKSLKEAILKISNNMDLLLDKEKELNEYIDKYYSDNKINKYILEYEKLIINKVLEFQKLIHSITDKDTTDFDNLVDNTINSKDYKQLQTNIEILINNYPKGTGTPSKNIRDELKELISNSKEEIKEYYLSTKEYVEVIIDIIKELDKRLNAYKYENDTYEYNDIAKLAITLLENNKEIQKELKNSFKEIIIDEYQDTSDIQEKLISLISNNNVYCVGDIKQSIYRFRNANPYIFKKKYDSYSTSDEGIKLDLTGNFRSREEVIKNINKIFNVIMTDEMGGANYLKEHNMNPLNEDYKNKVDQEYGLKVLEYEENEEYDNEEIEAFIIAKDIENKKNNHYQIYDKKLKKFRDVTYKDFTILIDRRDSFDTYGKIFTYKNIPLVQKKDVVLNDQIELYLVKNIIKLILKLKENNKDQEFRYLFTSIARSYLYSIDDNTIYQTINNNTYDEIEFIKKAKEISKDIDNLTLTNLVDIILKEFNYYTNVVTTNNIKQSQIGIEQIKTYTKELEEMGLTIKEFTDYIDELLDYKIDLKYKVEDDGEAVKIMTIHASKGLQYPVCYYSGLYKRLNFESLKNRFLYDNDYGIITPYFKEGIGVLFTKELLKEKTRKEEISEKIRLFYVALTRAEEDMIIVKPYTDKVVTNYYSLQDILSDADSVIKPYTKSVQIEDIDISKNYLYFKSKDISKMIPTNSTKIKEINYNIDKEVLTENKYSKTLNNLIDDNTKKELEYGTQLHEKFELDDFKNPKNEITKKFLRHFDITKSINIMKEYEFALNNNIGIIDLIIEYDDYIDIIDYKTKGIDDESYSKQLKGYKAYVETLTSKKVNTYLYSIINDELKQI